MASNYPVWKKAPLDSAVGWLGGNVGVFRARRSQFVMKTVRITIVSSAARLTSRGIRLKSYSQNSISHVRCIASQQRGTVDVGTDREMRNAVSIVVVLCCSVHRIRTTACFCWRPHSEDWVKRKKNSRSELKVDVFISVLWSEVKHSGKLPDCVKLRILPCLLIRDSDVTGTRHWTYYKNYRIHIDIGGVILAKCTGYVMMAKALTLETLG